MRPKPPYRSGLDCHRWVLLLALVAPSPASAQVGCQSQQTWEGTVSSSGAASYIGRCATDALGRRIVVGNPLDDQQRLDSGSVSVFDRVGTSWVESHVVMPSVPIANSGFGFPITLSGDGRVLAVTRHDFGVLGVALPSVFVFAETQSGWDEAAEIPSPTPVWPLDYGEAIELDATGSRLAIGSTFEWVAGIQAGVVRVYSRDTNWNLEAVIEPADPSEFLKFGGDVAFSDDASTLAVGARGDDLLPWTNSEPGAVYVFRRSGSSWAQIAKLVPAVRYWQAHMGASVAISGDGRSVFAGAPDDSEIGWSNGAVNLFEELNGAWSEVGKLFTSFSSPGYFFGSDVQLTAGGTGLLVGEQSGTILYHPWIRVLRRDGQSWTHVGVCDPLPHLSPGSSVLIFAADTIGRTIVVGEPYDDTYGVDAGLIRVLDSTCFGAQSYCTAKTNSLGCVPAIASSGWPSLSEGSGFLISAQQLLNQKLGYLFCGVGGRAALPFQGGVLCVMPPVLRTPAQQSGGSPIGIFDCSGAFSLDFNSWLVAQTSVSLAIGQWVGAQYWSRDPASAFGSSLTDATEFVLAP